MTATTSVEKLWQYKSKFSLDVEQILAFASSMLLLAWSEKLRICLQILKELYNNVLRYRQFSFG